MGNQDYKIEALHLVEMVIGKASLKKSEEMDSGEESVLGQGPEVGGAWSLLGTEPRPVLLENRGSKV